ncbi:TonB-dependent receptor plug domain-containing protein [candidate division CSSED10-310 bacterium]|uniref:TonB-dependent receptor plug domain-containing protein n=1 Tax=candidate division CSSED10-310 bacterium TaxID=2855610 RepID=A0ABV6YUB4_UNCC1
MKKIMILTLMMLPCLTSYAQEDYFGLLTEESFGELYKSSLASGIKESIFDAPASMIVISATDIKQRGYTSLDEVVEDLPGFDVIVANGPDYLFAYQRGYRTPFTQRTLLMVNNQVDNHLWSHSAAISRHYPLTNVKKIEILYGPTSSIYGPNAFLGIINIITEDGTELIKEDKVSVSMQVGSYHTRSLDVSMKGNKDKISYAFSGKIFKSDEPDLSGRFGFLDNEDFKNEQTWGPLLQDSRFGEYKDPTNNYGILGSLSSGNIKFGLIHWVIREGYGPYYAADRVQNNVYWCRNSSQFYLEYETEMMSKVSGTTLLLYRESDIYGEWVEALPDWEEGMEEYSYISDTEWNAVNNSWLFKQNFEITALEDVVFTGGIKFERKEFTKAYDIPGYWDAFSSVALPNNGPYDLGYGVGHSSDSDYTKSPPPSGNMPADNLVITEDIGGFIQGIVTVQPFRFHAGIRYDENSIYGSSTNPRVSVIYKFLSKGALKLLYGEAFQEPSPIQLWGGWSGRLANPDIKPEKARHTEFNVLYSTKHFIHDTSLFMAHYTNVINEESINAGSRDTQGLEYRLRFYVPNMIPHSSDISGYFYYTYTSVTSSITYNHTTQLWEDEDDDLGDIAPHKINFGLNLPLKQINLNFRGNYVSERKLYLRNPLRDQGIKLEGYLVFNCALCYSYGPYELSVKIRNLFNKDDYYHPGLESADSGNDFSRRSQGFRNSLIPQPGRSYLVNLTIHY